jgi:hypothetical protein
MPSTKPAKSNGAALRSLLYNDGLRLRIIENMTYCMTQLPATARLQASFQGGRTQVTDLRRDTLLAVGIDAEQRERY